MTPVIEVDRRNGGPMDWIDVSVPLRSDLPAWPGDVPVEFARRMKLEDGADYNISMLTLSTHSGTHMDAPLHFIEGGVSIDQMPLDTTVGPARVIEIADTFSIKPLELDPHDLQLFKTANSESDWRGDPFKEDYVYISPEGAAFLVERGVRCVGIDYMSVGSTHPDEAKATHEILLRGGVWIIECLYLVGVPAGPYEMVCLPLKVEGAEGAPARAILRTAR
jgi:arylformamidase